MDVTRLEDADSPAEGPHPELPPRLWRGESALRAGNPRRRPIAVTLICLTLCALLGFVSFWFDPLAPPAFVPILMDGSDGLAVPIIPQAANDFRALLDPKRHRLGASRVVGSINALSSEIPSALASGQSNTLIVYLAARACRDPDNEKDLLLLSPEASSQDGLAPDGSRLESVLERIQWANANHKLLILDLHPAAVDSGRDLPADDLFPLIRATLNRFPDDRLLVLTSCGAGEFPGSSEALGRSAFGFYVEEGLRGWADASANVSDGRVTARELASYVAGRVDRWSVKARGVHQTPTLYDGDDADLDFPLVTLAKARPAPPMTLPEKDPTTYPAWLRTAWTLRDDWLRDMVRRDAPSLMGKLETALLTAELDWRGGIDPEVVQARLREILDGLKIARQAAQRMPRPASTSLAQEEAAGRVPDASVVAAVAELLAKRPEPKPGEGQGAETKAIADFFATTKIPSDFDLAAAVMRAATSERSPSRDAVAFLDRLLRGRQPRPVYVETDALNRLATVSAADWNSEWSEKLLSVVIRGERAASRPGPVVRVAPLLNEAEAARYQAEVLIACRGDVPDAEISRQLGEADAALADLLTTEDAVERVRKLVEETLHRLTASLPVVDAEAGLAESWDRVANASLDLIKALDRPTPSNLTATREEMTTLGRLESRLTFQLETLNRPFAAERVARLAASEGTVNPDSYRAIAALLATPVPQTAQRVALWTRLRAIDRRLNAEVRNLDRLDAGEYLPPSTEKLTNAPPTDPGVIASRAKILQSLAEGGTSASEGVSVSSLDQLRRADRRARLGPARPLEPWVLEADPTRQLRATEREPLRVWLAEEASYRARDFEGSPFFAAAARLLHRPGDPTPPVLILQSTPETISLESSRPETSVALKFLIKDRDGAAEPDAYDVVPADDVWLEFAQSGSTTQPHAGRLEFPWTSSDMATSAALLKVRLRPDPETASPLPRGFLIQTPFNNRTYHHRIAATITPASRRLRIAFGPDPAHVDVNPVPIRLRAVPEPTTYYLQVINPTDSPQSLVVRLVDDGEDARVVDEAALKVEAKATAKVAFGPPSPKPEADWLAVRGPIRVRVFDAGDRDRVLAEQILPVGVKGAADLVRVVEAYYDPGVSNFSIQLQAVAPLGGTPCAAALVLDPAEIPGLLSTGEGTQRVELTSPDEVATINAEGIRLDNREDENGRVSLTIDGIERALILRSTFARSGEPTTPRLDVWPRIALQLPAMALADAPLKVAILLDNPPPGGRIELTLGRYVQGKFQIERDAKLPATRERIRINTRGPSGEIRLAAQVEDPVATLDVRRIRGRRELRVRMFDAEGRQVAEDVREIVFDDRPPVDVRLERLAKYALKGSTLEVRASGTSSAGGLKKVVVFAGLPTEEKIPANVQAIEATPLDPGRTSWAAKLPLPDGRKGPLDITAQFVNGLGLSTFRSTSVEVVDTIPTEPGIIRGKVVEGTRPQVDLEVVLRDAKGAEKGRVTTDRKGEFAFTDLAPGEYRVICFKPTPPTQGDAAAPLAAGKTMFVNVEMLRTGVRAGGSKP